MFITMPAKQDSVAADSPEEMASEARRIRLFRFLTDLTHQRLAIEALTLSEARALVDGLRPVAESFFPGRTHVFDLVIAPRLERVIGERFGEEAVRPPRLCFLD
jgi:hypothetical protein